MKRLSVIALAAVLTALGPVAGSTAPQAESTFDGWSLNGTALDGEGRVRAEEKRALPCRDVHDLISAYNLAQPWSNETPPVPSRLEAHFDAPGEVAYAPHITPINLSDYEVDSVGVWAAVEMFDEFVACTGIHNTGWLPAGSGLISLARHGGVAVDDRLAQCGHGELLFVRAHFLYRPGSGWSFAPGVNHTDDFDGFELSVGDSTELVCGRIFEGHEDVAGFSEEVPAVQVNHNPLVVGLTGLETWLWYDFGRPDAPSSVSRSVTIDSRGTEWTLEAIAWMDRLGWDADCATSCDYRGLASGFDATGIEGPVVDFADSLDAMAPLYDGGSGTDVEAAATHVYEEKGIYTISTVTFWRGLYTWAGVSYRYAPVVVAGSSIFEVQEIRGSLSSGSR